LKQNGQFLLKLIQFSIKQIQFWGKIQANYWDIFHPIPDRHPGNLPLEISAFQLRKIYKINSPVAKMTCTVCQR